MHLSFPEGHSLSLDGPRIMGVLNVTPDSFSDGGRHTDVDTAAAAARSMLDQGADLLDVGGESTRPGAEPVDVDEQCRRVLPVIERLHDALAPLISIDTTSAAVAEAALDAGACMINDVSAGRHDPEMLALAADRGVPLVLMHMQGMPRTMQDDPRYDDVVEEVAGFLRERLDAAEDSGVRREQVVLDPGIGFGKRFEHNLDLLAQLDRLLATGQPVLVGASRKRFLGTITGEADPTRRDAATAAVTALAVAAGVRLIRVHNVAANRHAADVAFALVARRAAPV